MSVADQGASNHGLNVIPSTRLSGSLAIAMLSSPLYLKIAMATES